jgi:hypothetical protein
VVESAAVTKIDVDDVIAQLDKLGWSVWHVGRPGGQGCEWSALLYTDHDHPAVQQPEMRSMGGLRGGFSHAGYGNTWREAIVDAASDILPEPKMEVLTLEQMLR